MAAAGSLMVWQCNGWLAAAPASIAPASGGSVVDAQARAVLAALIAALQAQGVLV